MYFIRDYDGPKPFNLENLSADVLLLGQDPTVDRDTRFSTVLGLDASVSSGARESLHLQQYIFGKILTALKIEKSRLLATNLVNLYYCDVPNKIIAKKYRDLIIDIAKREGIDVDRYPDKANGSILHAINFKVRTQREFEKMLMRSSVLHLITLGEPVFQVLRERYNLDFPSKLRQVLQEINGKPKIVSIGLKQVTFLPLPHIFNENNARWDFYNRFIVNELPLLFSSYNLS